MARRWNELLMEDHTMAEKVIAAMDNGLALRNGPPDDLVRGALDYFTKYADRCHNQKEEQHLFPLLEKRGIPRSGGPLAVMLAEHDRSEELLAQFVPLARSYVGGDKTVLPDLKKVFGEYGALLKQHYWKENDILYPMGLRVLNDQDNEALLAGFTALEDSLEPGIRERYFALARELADLGAVKDLSYGVARHVMAAMLNALPVELSFVDANDEVAYFSHENHDKIFGRNRSAIGTNVTNCHPQKSLHMVKQIIADFKAGTRASADFWIDMGPRKIYIRYFPVRDDAGKYLGTMEVVQDVTAIQKLEGQKRLLD